jgi:type II secretory pathway pseudopilin PulG
MKLSAKGFIPLEMNNGSSIDYGNISNKIIKKKRFLSLTGFTLSELLLAAVILAFALSGLLTLFVNCMFLNESNRNLTIATGHAQYVMEEIKNTNFAALKTKIDNGDWDWDGQDIGSKGLTALSNESIDTNATGTDPLDVTVTVNWKDRGTRDRNTVLETLITGL